MTPRSRGLIHGSGYKPESVLSLERRGPNRMVLPEGYVQASSLKREVLSWIKANTPFIPSVDFIDPSNDAARTLADIYYQTGKVPCFKVDTPEKYSIAVFLLFAERIGSDLGNCWTSQAIASMRDPSLADKASDNEKFNLRFELSQEEYYLDYIEEVVDVDIPACCLFPWKKNIEDEILEYSCVPPESNIAPKRLKKFKEHFKEMLEEFGQPFREPDRFDWISYLTDSKVWDGKKVSNLDGRSRDDTLLYSHDFKFYQCFVQKNAEETRCAVCGDIPTLNSIKALDSIASSVFRSWPHDCMKCKDLNKAAYNFYKKVKKTQRSENPKIIGMADIKKCGLTFPQELLSAVAEVLADYYNNDTFLLLKNFVGAEYYDSTGKFLGKIYKGYFLGMANRYASAIISCLWDMFKLDDEFGIFFNDDECVAVNSPDRFEEWMQFLEGYGIWVNREKSCFSQTPIRMVFCERYFGMDHDLMLRRIFRLYQTVLRAPDLVNAHENYYQFESYIKDEMEFLDDQGLLDIDVESLALHSLKEVKGIIEECFPPIAKEAYPELGGFSENEEGTGLELSVWGYMYQWQKYVVDDDRRSRIYDSMGLPKRFQYIGDGAQPSFTFKRLKEASVSISRREQSSRTWKKYASQRWASICERLIPCQAQLSQIRINPEPRMVEKWSVAVPLPTPIRDPLYGQARLYAGAGLLTYSDEKIEGASPLAWAPYPNYAINQDDWIIASQTLATTESDVQRTLYGYIADFGAFPILIGDRNLSFTPPKVWVSSGILSCETDLCIDNLDHIQTALRMEFGDDLVTASDDYYSSKYEMYLDGRPMREEPEEEEDPLEEELYNQRMARALAEAMSITIPKPVIDASIKVARALDQCGIGNAEPPSDDESSSEEKSVFVPDYGWVDTHDIGVLDPNSGLLGKALAGGFKNYTQDGYESESEYVSDPDDFRSPTPPSEEGVTTTILQDSLVGEQDDDPFSMKNLYAAMGFAKDEDGHIIDLEGSGEESDQTSDSDSDSGESSVESSDSERICISGSDLENCSYEKGSCSDDDLDSGWSSTDLPKKKKKRKIWSYSREEWVYPPSSSSSSDDEDYSPGSTEYSDTEEESSSSSSFEGMVDDEWT